MSKTLGHGKGIGELCSQVSGVSLCAISGVLHSTGGNSLCPRAFHSLWVEFLQCLASDVPVWDFLLGFLNKGKPSVNSEHNLWTKRTESVFDGIKNREKGWENQYLPSTKLMSFISSSTNLHCKFMFIVPKCIVLYVILLNFILFLLFMSHGFLAFSLWYPSPSLCRPCPISAAYHYPWCLGCWKTFQKINGRER